MPLHSVALSRSFSGPRDRLSWSDFIEPLGLLLTIFSFTPPFRTRLIGVGGRLGPGCGSRVFPRYIGIYLLVKTPFDTKKVISSKSKKDVML